MSLIWSKYQQDIFNYALDPDKGSFCIEAVAGSGKTTVLVETAKRLAAANPNEEILFLSFNKSIARKLKEETRDYPNMKCSTVHALGFSTLCRSKIKFEVDEKKWINYLKRYYEVYVAKYIEDYKGKSRQRTYIRNCLRLFALCRANLVKFDNTKEIERIAALHGIVPIHNEVVGTRLMLEKAMSLYAFRHKEKGKDASYYIDFDDMINLPLTDAFRKFIPQYAFVMCDEAQDMSKAQQELVCSALRKYGKLIAIGDSKQSIYYFATGKANTFADFKERCNNVCLPLSVCYRCGKNIVKEAQKINPDIEPYEEMEDGEVIHQDDLSGVKPGDMILCRAVQPLIEIMLKYMEAGIKAYIKGKDFGEILKGIIVQLTDNEHGVSRDRLYKMLDGYLLEIFERLVQNGVEDPVNHIAYQNALLYVDCIKRIGWKYNEAYDIYLAICRMFLDDDYKGFIMLSTVHRAKGLEADNVYIVCPDILPMISERTTPTEAVQEKNIQYVAITRAKKKLVYVDYPTYKECYKIEI